VVEIHLSSQIPRCKVGKNTQIQRQWLFKYYKYSGRKYHQPIAIGRKNHRFPGNLAATVCIRFFVANYPFAKNMSLTPLIGWKIFLSP
jgi:hypothetical protein